MKNIIGLISLVFLFAICCENTALADEECDQFISKLPSDFFTGYVSVPEDWNNISGRKIKVFYYGRKDSTNDETVVFFNGGPSASSRGSFASIEEIPESKKINFVYIDQRGNGCSDSYPSGANEETAKRLLNYTSRSIVKDAEAIREKVLGPHKKWKIFGQSYGGLIVHRYVEMAPESIIAAYAHGYAIMTDQVEWMKLRILSQKRVTEDYFQEYPQDRADLEKVKGFIPKDRCFTDEGISLCGPVILDVLRHPLGFRDLWEGMHWWIENLAKYWSEYPDMIQGLANMFYTDFTHDSLPSLIINKIEITKGPSDRDECKEAFIRLKKTGDDPDLWPINECRVLISIQNEKFDPILNSVTKVDPLTLNSVQSSLQRNPGLRFYLYAGQKDVFVPVETFEEETLKLRGLINFKLFPNSGHEGFRTEKQVWEDLLQ